MSRVTGLSITTLGASNMLLMNSLIQIRHRPILDLLPGLLERGRHLVHVFWPVPAIGLTACDRTPHALLNSLQVSRRVTSL